MNFPFKERVISEGVVERTFSSGTGSDELIWHRDREDRHLLVVESGGWQFQMDNSLPVNLEPGQELLVPAGAWHRVISGNNDLKIIINKGQQPTVEGAKMKLTNSQLHQIIREEHEAIIKEAASQSDPAQVLANEMEGTLHALEDGYLLSIDELIPIFRGYIKRARELST